MVVRPVRVLPFVRLLAWFAAAGTLLVVSPRAQAAEPGSPVSSGEASARIADLNEAGSKHYEDRNYRLAIEKFIEAYAIDHDPNLLFNIARCYEELGEVEAAIEKYEAFVDAKGADAEGRVRAQASLRALRALRLERLHQPDAGEKTAQDASRDAEPASASSAAGSPGILPWAALGAGVVMTGTGTVLYLLGSSDHDRVTGAPGFDEPSGVHPMTRAEADALVTSGNTKKLMGGVGIGLGGALLGASIALFLTSGDARKGGASPAIALDTGKNHVSATICGRF